jgi:hypothetical protein
MNVGIVRPLVSWRNHATFTPRDGRRPSPLFGDERKGWPRIVACFQKRQMDRMTSHHQRCHVDQRQQP